MRKTGWRVEKSPNGVFMFIKKVPWLPITVGKLQRFEPKRLDSEWVRDICLKYKVSTLYMEPVNNFPTDMWGLKLRSTRPLLPSKTLVLDLSQNLSELQADLKSKTRYNTRLALKRGVRVELIEGNKISRELLEKAQKILVDNSRRVGFITPKMKDLRAKIESFNNKLWVALAWLDNNLVAVLLVMCSDDAAFYDLNGSTNLGRKVMAPTLLTWEAIKAAREQGLREFNFDGIYDSRSPHKRWKGFSVFKSGFGGTPRIYPMAKRLGWLPL